MQEIKCPNCEKYTDDYIILSLTRIKDGVPYFPDQPVVMCLDCYVRLVKAQDIIIDKNAYMYEESKDL